MTAAVRIQRRFGWHPARIPECVSLSDINIMAAAVRRNAVIPVSGQPKKPCILIKAVSPAGVGKQRKKILCSQVVDPRKRCFWSRNDILLPFIIEISVFHKTAPPHSSTLCKSPFRKRLSFHFVIKSIYFQIHEINKNAFPKYKTGIFHKK